jgi:acyl dehydratase
VTGGDGSGWFDGLVVGHEEVTPQRVLTGEVLRSAIDAAGYRHPLFVDPAYAAASALGGVPVPGGVLLGVVGGMVEHCPLLELAPVVLAGFDDVRFRRPVLAGDTLSVRVRVESAQRSERGTRTAGLSWTARNQRAEVVMTAAATFVVTDGSRPG